MPQEELTQEQKDSMVPILNALEEHYIKVRKTQVDKMQEIENQLETFAGNELVVSGLAIIRSNTQYQIDQLEMAYKQILNMTERYNKQLHGIVDSKYYGY